MKVWNRLLACFNGLSLLGLFLFLDLNRHKNTTARTRQQGVVKKKKASVLGRQVRHKTRIRSTLGVHSEVERAVLKCSPSEVDRLLQLLQARELLWRGFLKKVVDLVHRRILFVMAAWLNLKGLFYRHEYHLSLLKNPCPEYWRESPAALSLCPNQHRNLQ